MDPNKRAASVVDRYLLGIERLQQRDEQVDVVVCVVPDIVYENCRPQSRVRDGLGFRPSARARRERKRGQGDLLDPFDPEIYQYSVDFRRQLKARSMQYGIPVQIIRESTLRSEADGSEGRRLTPLSDRAWNLGVALYYKAGGKPWRLSNCARRSLLHRPRVPSGGPPHRQPNRLLRGSDVPRQRRWHRVHGEVRSLVLTRAE